MSNDDEAQISECAKERLTFSQAALERVIIKVFKKYSLEFEISDSVRSTFKSKSKLWRMGKQLSQLGGTKRTQLLQKWKSDENAWNLTIQVGEVIRQLPKRKRQAEQKLDCEVIKRRKCESQVKELKAKANELEKRNKKQAEDIFALRTGQTTVCHRTSSKKWDQYSRQGRP